jgi:small subunit ribosomal protein S6
MLRYETLLLGKTEMTEDDIAALERSFDTIITAGQGKLSSFDKWGKYRLAFPVEKQTQGIYILVRYELPVAGTGATINKVDEFLKIKCNELVLRHVNIRLKANAPTTYMKPDPIDAIRTGTVDAFIKDNKIDTLLNSVHDADDSSADDIN